MASNEIHLGDVGLSFEVTVKDQNLTEIDLSGTSDCHYYMKKPDGSVVIFPCSFIDDGTDGGVKYIFQDGDLDLTGTWKYQVMFEFGSNKFWSDIGKFKVYPNVPNLP